MNSSDRREVQPKLDEVIGAGLGFSLALDRRRPDAIAALLSAGEPMGFADENTLAWPLYGDAAYSTRYLQSVTGEIIVTSGNQTAAIDRYFAVFAFRVFTKQHALRTLEPLVDGVAALRQQYGLEI